jgi:hypothetical protein
VTATSAIVTAPAASPPVERDRRGSWIPTWSMVTTRFMELRRRRGVMITIAVVTIGIPSLFFAIRIVLHAVAPHSYGPAGGPDVYTTFVAGVLYVFGFIVAAMLGCTAGSVDLTDGMFRHLVVTGRSRLALYFARIPAGLAIILSMVAVGFTIVCVVCSLAAPTAINYQGANIPAGLSLSGFESWAGAHPDSVFCNFRYNAPTPGNVPCGGPNFQPSPGPANSPGTDAQLRALARSYAAQYGNYQAYRALYLTPPISLMVGSGLWLLLEATIGFVVGLGLGSLLGQRTISVILMIVLEVILTPIIGHGRIPYLINLQRSIVGIATVHLEPSGLTRVIQGGPNGHELLLPESTYVAIFVVIAWLVGWTALGAWRMATRDA